MKLLITTPAFKNPHMQQLIEFARQEADEVVLNPYGRTMTTEELMGIWDNAEDVYKRQGYGAIDFYNLSSGE